MEGDFFLEKENIRILVLISTDVKREEGRGRRYKN